MEAAIPPSLIYFIGALLVPLFRGRARQVFAVLVPLVGFLYYFSLNAALKADGVINPVTGAKELFLWTHQLLDFQLVLGRIDGWSLIFYNIFALLGIIGIIYNLKGNSALELSAGLLYAGAALGAVMAGDLITMFVFWELLTVGAILLILSRNTARANRAAYRYFLIHVLGGVILLAGLGLHIQETGSIAFGKIGLSGMGSWLIFIGLGINCAWPVVGAWLTDTYPEASVGGLIFMATFTTKTAVFVLARTFPGEEALIWIGIVMAVVPLFYAVISNDLRRVLAYCLINQVGFMVIGIGIGTALSLNGTAAHAYCHILYKALLFMSIGAVMYRTGTSRATDLGGLVRSMPFTCACCAIGALSTSFPFFCGFVSKAMILSAAAKGGEVAAWLAMMFGAAAVFHQAGLKVTYFAFFSRDSGIRCQDAPGNMKIAMGLTALVSIVVGTFPHATLYKMLPEAASYEPYTVGHVTDQITLLAFASLAFALMILAGVYPAEVRSVNLDAGWIYRKGGRGFYWVMDKSLNAINRGAHATFIGGFAKWLTRTLNAAPTELLCWLLTPYWKLRGLSATEMKQHQDQLRLKSQFGAFPIGVTACLAVFLLALLILLA